MARSAESSGERKSRDVAAEEFFYAYRFDDILPLRLEIVDERKEKAKKSVIYSIRVQTGPFADAAYKDFIVQISTEALRQLVHDLKTVGYTSSAISGNGRTETIVHYMNSRENTTPSPSPVPSVTSDNSVSGASVASDLDVITALTPDSLTNSRRRYWQDFLHSICTSLLASTNPSLRYLLFPKLNLTDWHRLAMQHATMVLHSEGVWEVEERLPGIGWRFAKHYAVVREVTNRDSRLMMSWTFLGRKYSHCEVKERQEALKQLLKLQHPLIYPIMYETFHEAGCLIMQQICPSGSLKDRIYKAKPSKPFHKKYTRCHERRPFNLDDVRLYGRQILEALNAIHECGIPYGNLHARNVMLDNGVCRLTDLHNTIVGLPGYYRPYLIQLPKICMFPSIDVYCFGRILYEMTFGEGLDAPCIESIPPECPSDVQPVLNLLITTEACFVKGMPTVKFLLSVPLFNGVDLGFDCPPIKLTSRVVGSCRGLAERYETRLSAAEKAFHDSLIGEGVFFRPISPVLGRMKKSGSIQVIKKFFSPSHHHNHKVSCIKPKTISPYDHSNADDSNSSDPDDPTGGRGRTRSKSLVASLDAKVPVE